jgi:hypothetical protein
VLPRIQLERTQPLAGTAAAKEAQPRRFGGWLELLRVIAELVAAAPVGGEEADAAEEPLHRSQTKDASRLHPGRTQAVPGPTEAQPASLTTRRDRRSDNGNIR